MIDWLIVWLGQIQGGILRTMSGELRSGGIGTVGFAFALGALHALTPGHGKVALAAYFLGREARIGKGVRVALTAALLHVLSGLRIPTKPDTESDRSRTVIRAIADSNPTKPDSATHRRAQRVMRQRPCQVCHA